MSDTYTLDQYVADLRRIAREADGEDRLLAEVAPLARKLALDRSWLKPEHYEADAEQGFGVHLVHEEDDHSLAVFVVSWLPGRGADAHDHGTWAVVAGIEGDERNVRYKRVDDRSRPGYAELEVKAEFTAGPGDVLCIRDGGVHAVWNDGDQVSLSLHTYGKHINHTGRSQYDLDTNTVKPFVVDVR